MQRPIVPFIKLPEGGGTPYLVGSRCKACGQVYVGTRRSCPRCYETGQMQEIRLSDRGELYLWTIVHQSAPGINVPYVAGIVDLPEGVSLRANVEGIEPKPENLRFGMPLELFFEVVRQDREGNEIVAYKFRPAAA